MPTKVDSTNLERELNAVKSQLKKRKIMFLTAKFVISMIVKRTRDEAKGVSSHRGRKESLKKVSPEWANFRKKIADKHPKAPKGRKSNLTFKGTMLDSLTVLKVTNDNFFIGWNESKEADKAKGNADRGRPFMFLSRSEVTKTSDFIKMQILKNI